MRAEAIPFEWHHHPEFELTLTTNSRGHRFVGDHVGTYGDGDLVMIGPSIPHTWASSGKVNENQPHNVMVIWFKPEWARGLTGLLTELRTVTALLGRASRGLVFSPQVASMVRSQVEDMFDKPPADRLLDLMSILLALAEDHEAEQLTSPALYLSTPDLKETRIERVLEYIHANYRSEIRVETVAGAAALSISAFHRMFTRHTRLTLTGYVMRLRIGAACAILVANEQPIRFVAEAVGYRSLANFNRQFKILKGQTPRQYRNHFRG